MSVALRAERALRAYSLGVALDDAELPGLPVVALTNSVLPPLEAIDILNQLAELPERVVVGITQYAVSLSAALDEFSLEEAISVGETAAELQAFNLGVTVERDTVLAEAIELALANRDDPHAAATQSSNSLVAAVSASLVAAAGGWSQATQDASDLLGSVNGLEFKTQAEQAVAMRGRLTGDLDV